MTEAEASNKRQEAYFVFREIVRKWKGPLTKKALLGVFREVSDGDDAWKTLNESCPACLYTPCRCLEINHTEGSGHRRESVLKADRRYSDAIAKACGRGNWYRAMRDIEDKA